MKMRHQWVPAVLLAAGLLMIGAGSAAAVTLDFECGTPDCSFNCADTLDVYLTVDAVSDLRGYSLELAYDAAVIQVIDVATGDLVDGSLPFSCPFTFFWLNPTPPFGAIQADGAGPGCSVDGPGRLMHMQFIGAGHGVSPISVTSSILRNSLNQSISHTSNAGAITFNCPPVPAEEKSWGAIKVRYE